MTLGELVKILGGKLVQGSPAILLAGVDSSVTANGLDLVFAEDETSAAQALAGGAAAVVLKAGCVANYAENPNMGVVEADQPRLWFARAARHLKRPVAPAGVHSTAVIGALVELGEDITIGAGAVIGECASIGDGTRIEAGAVTRSNGEASARASATDP